MATREPWKFDSDGHCTVTIPGTPPRTYLVHMPLLYSPETPHPLVLSFHGHSSNSEEQELRTGLSRADLALDGVGIVAVYPQGVFGLDEFGAEGSPAWQGAPYSRPDIDDVCTESCKDWLRLGC